MRLVRLFLCAAFALSALRAWALDPEETKQNMLAALSSIANYAAAEHSESTAHPVEGAAANFPKRVSDTRMQVDLTAKAVHVEAISRVAFNGQNQQVGSEFYILNNVLYQLINEQWFKAPAAAADMAVFDIVKDDKNMLVDSRIEFIEQNPFHVMVMPDKEKFITSFLERLRLFAGSANAQPKARVERLIMEYWLDKNFCIGKKNISVSIVLSFAGQSDQVIEYDTKSEFTGYNAQEPIRLVPAAVAAQDLPLRSTK